MPIRLIVCILKVAIFLSSPGYAQTVNDDSRDDVKRAVEQAWQRAVVSHTLAGKEAEVHANRIQAEAIFAGAPAIGLANRHDRWTTQAGVQENEVSLSVPIWLPGQRAARHSVLDAEADKTDAVIAASKLNLAGEIRERIWSLVALETDITLEKKRLESSRALEEDVNKRVKAGDLARADALLAQQETLNAQIALHDAELKFTEALTRWEILTGLKRLPSHYEESVQSLASIEHHPRILAARSARTRAEKQLQLVAATRHDAPEVGMSYRWERGGNTNPSDRTIGVAIKIPLATEARNRPLETAAQTEIATAVAEERVARESVLGELNAAKALLDQTEARLQLSEKRTITARERASLIKKSFELGEQSLAEWLRARVPVFEAEASLARDRAALGLARARLNQAQGVLP